MAVVNIPTSASGYQQSVVTQANAAQRAVNRMTMAPTLNPKGITQPLGKITASASEFQKSMDASAARVFAFGAAVGIINGISSAFKNMIDSAREVEKALKDVQVVMAATNSEMAQFGQGIFDVAKNTASSFSTVSESAIELARQGLGAEETLKRVNSALILSRLSGLNAVKSTETLTAAINSFNKEGITHEQVINRMANVDAAFAVSSKDLAEAISRAGAVAQSSGVSFNELAAIVTAVQQRTARGGSVIGNGFKSIFTRIKRSGVRESLEEIGVATKDMHGNFRSGISILKDYADVYKTLSDSQKSYTSEQIAGVFQIQNLQALIQDLGSGYSVYDKSLKVANDTTNEAIVRNERLNETLDAIFKSTTLSAKQLGATLGEIALSDSFKNILQFLGNLADGLNNLFDEKTGSDFAKNLVKGIGAFITGPGLVILGAAFIKLFALIGKFAKDAFKDLLGLNLESKRQASLQGAITAALSQNSTLMKSMVAAGSSQAKQEQVILNFIRQETTERLKQEAILKRIAGSGVLRGIGASQTGFIPGGNRTSRTVGRRTLGIAGGFIPSFNEESRNIRKGVGGARSGDKPVGVTVGLGGGKKMSAVAHTGEWRVPWGGGSEAIFNRDMASKFGLPKGSKKITAGDGFVPNFAKTKTPSTSARATTLDFSKLVTMLIPQKSTKGSATSKWKDKSGGIYNVKFQVRGPDASAVKRVDPMINKMANTSILADAGKAANKLGKNEFTPGPGPKSLTNSELAVTKGRIFEVAAARVLKAPKFVKDQATFDMMNPDVNKANLFNWNTPFADAKTGPQHAKSVAGKIVKFFGSGGGKGRAMGAKPIKDLMAQIDKGEVKGFKGKQAERSRLGVLSRLAQVGITPGVGGRVGAFGKSLQGQAAQAGKQANFRKNVLGYAGGFIPNFAPFSLASLSGRQIGRLKAGNTLNVNGKSLGVKDLNSKDQTALLGHQSKSSKAATAAAASKKEDLKSRQLVDASRFATMLVSTRNHRAKVDRAVDRGKDKYRVRFRVEGIKKAGLIDEKKIRQRVRDVLVKESNRAAQDMVGPGDFAKNLPVMTNVMNAGALGGAAGTVFETALQAIQGNKLFKDNDNNARFDIQGFPNNKLSGMFGYHTQLGEAKISDTSDQRTSMINKILSQKSKFGVKPAGGKATYGKQKAAARVAKGLSGGFIPNFARGGFGPSAYKKRIGEESKKIASTSGLRYGKALSDRGFMGSGAENLVFAGKKNVFKVNPGTLRGGRARDTMGGESSNFQKHISSSSYRSKNFNKLVSKKYPAVFSPRTKGFKMGKGTLNVQGRVRGPTLQELVDRKLITKQEGLMLTDVIKRGASKATAGAGFPNNYPIVDSHLVNFVIPTEKVRSVIRALRGGERLSNFPRKSIAAIDVAKGFVPNFSDKSRAMETERAMGGNPGYREHPFPHVYDKDTQPTWKKTFNDHKSEGLGTAIQNSYDNQMGMSGGFTPNLMPRGGNTNWEMVSPQSKKSIDEFAADYDSTGTLPGPKDKFEGGKPMEASLGRQLGSQFVRRFEKLRSMGWRKRTPGEHSEFVSKWSKVKDKLNTKKKWLKYGSVNGFSGGFMPNFMANWKEQNRFGGGGQHFGRGANAGMGNLGSGTGTMGGAPRSRSNVPSRTGEAMREALLREKNLRLKQQQDKWFRRKDKAANRRPFRDASRSDRAWQRVQERRHGANPNHSNAGTSRPTRSRTFHPAAAGASSSWNPQISVDNRQAQERNSRAAGRSSRWNPQISASNQPGRMSRMASGIGSGVNRARAANDRFAQSPKAMAVQMGAMFMLPMLAEQIKANEGQGGMAGAGAAKGAATGAAYGSFFGLPGMAIGGLGGAAAGAVSGSEKTFDPIIKSFEKTATNAGKSSESINAVATSLSALHEAISSGDVKRAAIEQDKLNVAASGIADAELVSRLNDVTSGTASFSDKIQQLNDIFDESERKRRTAEKSQAAVKDMKKFGDKQGVMDFGAQMAREGGASGFFAQAGRNVMSAFTGMSDDWDDVGKAWSSNDGIMAPLAATGEVLLNAFAKPMERAVGFNKETGLLGIENKDLDFTEGQRKVLGRSFGDAMRSSGMGDISPMQAARDKVDALNKQGIGKEEALLANYGHKTYESLAKDSKTLVRIAKENEKAQMAILNKNINKYGEWLDKLPRRIDGEKDKKNMETVKSEILKSGILQKLGYDEEGIENFKGTTDPMMLRQQVTGIREGFKNLAKSVHNSAEAYEGMTAAQQKVIDKTQIAVDSYTKLARSIEEMSLAIETFNSRIANQFEFEEAMTASNFGGLRDRNNILESVGGITTEQNQSRQSTISQAEIKDSGKRNLERDILNIISNSIDPTTRLWQGQKDVNTAADVKDDSKGIGMAKINEQAEAADRKYTQELTDNFRTLIMQGGREGVNTQNMLRVVQMTGSKDQQLATQGLRLQNKISQAIQKSIMVQVKQENLLKEANKISALRSAAESINKWGSNVITGESVNGMVRSFNDAAQTGRSGGRVSGVAAESRNNLRETFGGKIINGVFNTTGLQDKLAVIASNLTIMRDVAVGEGDSNMVQVVDRLAADLKVKGDLMLAAQKSMQQIFNDKGTGGMLDPNIAALGSVMSHQEQLLAQQVQSFQQQMDFDRLYYRDSLDLMRSMPQAFSEKLAPLLQAQSTDQGDGGWFQNLIQEGIEAALPDWATPTNQGEPQANMAAPNIVEPLVTALQTAALNLNPDTTAVAFTPVIEAAANTHDLIGGLTKNITDYMGNLKDIVYKHGITGNMNIQVDTSAVERYLNPILLEKVKDIIGNQMIMNMIAKNLIGHVTFKQVIKNLK
jgi:TP901 family phage tail tape measure protein